MKIKKAILISAIGGSAAIVASGSGIVTWKVLKDKIWIFFIRKIKCWNTRCQRIRN
ncbi:Uncharacterised protein [Mycoplasmopsis pulmonis]|nr:Uncharacterised protein [Mycoplasmopsis pulmonis]